MAFGLVEVKDGAIDPNSFAAACQVEEVPTICFCEVGRENGSSSALLSLSLFAVRRLLVRTVKGHSPAHLHVGVYGYVYVCIHVYRDVCTHRCLCADVDTSGSRLTSEGEDAIYLPSM